ncbi:hypothetical protein ACQ4PT_061964 [Festuca glaucescens]
MAHGGFLSVDLGHPFLNRTADGFLKVGAVGACKVAAEETFHCLHKGDVSKHKVEHAFLHYCKKLSFRLDDDIWDIKFNFPGQDNLERKLSRSDITVLNLLSLIESYGYGIRDNMYYVKEKGRGVEGMELIDSMGKIVEMLALNEAEQVVNITVLKKNSVWPAGFNMEADEAEVLDVPVKFSVDNNGVNYISENEEFVPVAIDLTDVLYVGTQQSCNVPKGMQVPVDIMSDDEDAFFYPCQYNLEERNRLVAEEYELMHKLKRQKKEKEPDEEVVQIMHKLDEERKRRSNPAMHYEGDTDVEEIQVLVPHHHHSLLLPPHKSLHLGQNTN